jgi:hypothetical protein
LGKVLGAQVFIEVGTGIALENTVLVDCSFIILF